MKTSFTKRTFTNKIVSLLIFSFFMSIAHAGVIVSATGNSMQISADKASNAFSPAFSQLGDIMIIEKRANDFANSTGKIKSLILTAPSGWTFKPLSGNISINGKDLTAVSIKTTRTTITINFTVKGIVSMDAITISGIEVQSTNGAASCCQGNIYRSNINPGSAIINGIINTNAADGSGGTAFAVISQTTGTATKLVFATKPSATLAGAIFEQQPVIMVQDQFGNQTTNGIDENQTVKIKLSSGSGNLSGTTVMNIETGMANFSDLQVDALGAKKLIATSGSLTFAVSNEFTITEDDSSPRVSTEDSDDYDPDWICFLQYTNSSKAI